MSITQLILEAYPKARTDIAEAFDAEVKTLNHLGISDPRVLPHFLAQCAVESMYFTTLTEDLRYTIKGMLKIWPTHFTKAQARACKGSPEKIANRAYGGRIGNDKPGDGYRYRGGGVGMVTGKENYTITGRRIGVDLRSHPDLLRTDPRIAVRAFAAYFAQSKRQGLTAKDHALLGNRDMVSLVVNGGTNGRAARRKALKHIQLLMGGMAMPEIKHGSSGQAVHYLQSILAAIGLGLGGHDGLFGNNTQREVMRLQEAQGLEQTGRVDASTWDLLEKVKGKLKKRKSPRKRK